MLTRMQYNEAVKKYFLFLEQEWGYSQTPVNVKSTILYDIQYTNTKKIVSISYEIKGDGVKVIIFELIDGNLPEYDDKRYTIHLEHLTKDISKDELEKNIIENNNYFNRFDKPKDNVEKEILKKAKQLRLFLKSK